MPVQQARQHALVDLLAPSATRLGSIASQVFVRLVLPIRTRQATVTRLAPHVPLIILVVEARQRVRATLDTAPLMAARLARHAVQV